MQPELTKADFLSSESESDLADSKPADDAPREEWLRWHLSRRPPRTRQHYETLARILDGVRTSA
jgi:hypothetical protein